jgi:hypothetical protein
MKTTEFEHRLIEWQKLLREFESAFAQWGNELRRVPIDSKDPDWLKKIPPLPINSNVELRRRFRQLARDLATSYLEADLPHCKEIRRLIADFSLVAKYLCMPGSKRLRSQKDVDYFRLYLAIISIKDQACDIRDQIMELEELLDEARKAGIKPKPYLEEVAALSSNRNSGLGSMQQILRSYFRGKPRDLN